ncbi:MAG: efflux RND transporter permease subunit [Bacteroidales bacterium]
MPILDARQLVGQQLALAKAEIPQSYGDPELMPITTGLGEIYQYTLEVKKGYEEMYNPMEIRTIHDWIVKRQLNGIPGVVEISSFGGLVKQYEVAIDPNLLRTFNLSLLDVNQALLSNNQNTGGGYISRGPYVYYIRADGLIKTMEDIEKVVVGTRNGVPVLIRDIGEVKISSLPGSEQ